VKRERKAGSWSPKRQRKEKAANGFSLELWMLSIGRGLHEVMASAFGSCSAGMVWQRAMWDLLGELETDRLRRRVLGHFLRWFGRAKRHGSQFRVVDSSGFVGRAVETVRELDEQWVDDCGEVHERYTSREQHVPAFRGGRAGGMAAEDKRSPRTLHSYRRVLRGGLRCEVKPRSAKGRYLRQEGEGALVVTRQPPKRRANGEESDAVFPKVGDYAYAQAWLSLPPSPEMLARWGEKRPAPANGRKVELGSKRLPRLPGEPEALRTVLADLRQR
jgi:hypothetical protein